MVMLPPIVEIVVAPADPMKTLLELLLPGPRTPVMVIDPVEPVAVTLPPLSTSIPFWLVLFTAAPVPEIEIAPVAVVTNALSTRTPPLLNVVPPADEVPVSVKDPLLV